MSSAVFLARAAFVVGAALLFSAGVHAADAAPRKYAVLSLVGDKITRVVHRPSVGSNLDNNEQLEIAIEADLLDDAAAAAAGQEVMRIDPGSKAVVLAWRDPQVFELQDALITPGEKSKAALASLQGFLKQSKATHLLLITKYRADVYMPGLNGYSGGGKLRGLGFFLDGSSEVWIRETGKTGVGFLAPYAYLTVSVVDAESMQASRAKAIRYTTVMPTAGTDALNSWSVLTGAQKIRALQISVSDAVKAGVAAALAPQ